MHIFLLEIYTFLLLALFKRIYSNNFIENHKIFLMKSSDYVILLNDEARIYLRV